MHVLDKNTSRS